MKTNINENPLKISGEIPNIWEGWVGYKYAIGRHYDDGWRDVIVPEIDTETEKFGELYFDSTNDVGTYEIVPKTQQEIEIEAKSEVEQNQVSAIQNWLKEKVVKEAEALDDSAALDNVDIYPFWKPDEAVSVGSKRQDLNADNELKLYKCIQAHITQQNWRPKDTPALWVVVAREGEIPIWQQPSGAHDAYQRGDKVWFPDKSGAVYECMMANNVWSPSLGEPYWKKI